MKEKGVRFFLVANEIKTAKANVVQRMSFIASTFGQGSPTRERALSWGSRAQGRAARVFIGHRWGWGKVCLGELWQGFIGYCWGWEKSVGRISVSCLGFGLLGLTWLPQEFWRESQPSWALPNYLQDLGTQGPDLSEAPRHLHMGPGGGFSPWQDLYTWVMWLLPLAGPLCLTLLLISVAPCLIRYIQERLREVTWVSVSQLLLQPYSRLPTSDYPYDNAWPSAGSSQNGVDAPDTII